MNEKEYKFKVGDLVQLSDSYLRFFESALGIVAILGFDERTGINLYKVIWLAYNHSNFNYGYYVEDSLKKVSSMKND